MRTIARPVALAQTRHGFRSASTSFLSAGYGRAASYRRLHTLLRTTTESGRLKTYLHQNEFQRFPASSSFAQALPIRSYTVSQRLFQQSQSSPNQSTNSRVDPASQTAKSSAGSNETKSADTPDPADSQSKPAEESSTDSAKNGEHDHPDKEQDTKEDESKQKEQDTPEPPHGDKTPWQVFRETLSTEFKSSKEWNEGTQALSSGYDEVTQSEALKKAKAAYEESMRATSSTAAAAAKVVGKGAAAVWESPVGKVARMGASAAAEGLDKATKPVRDTEAFKSIANTIDDGSSSRYGGWLEKEERRRRRAAREAALGRSGVKFEKMEEDPDAGTNVTLHKDSAWKESWREFRQSSKLFQQFDGLKSTYQQSDNPLVSTARVWADTIGRFFAENETAMVIKKLREMDPSFQLEPFLIEMREYILPEVLDAYVKGDVATLKQWLSAAQYNVYAALMQQYTTQGLVSDGRILDIRNVDLANARLLDPGDVPVFVITCRTQEVHVYRNKKSGELAAGVDDKVQQVTYAIGVTRTAEDVSNPETRGWRLIELQKSARDYY